MAASAYPGASEITADGTDQDCDGTETCYVDADGDGHAEPTGLTTTSVALDCSDDGAAPIGAPADDCNDADVSVYPGATEAIADGVDQDCDGGEMCYVDADADGARSPDGSTVASSDMECDEEGEASGLASVDCDDGDASVHPGAEESPADGIDADCDGAELCYTDYDGDGYRPDDYSEVEGDLLCTGAGLVGADAPGGDCDDGDASINPEGEETAADGVDGNCDGIEQCYVDADNDGFRTTDGAIVDSESIDCSGDGVANADAPDTDCDDGNADVNPGMGDAIGDELDADCDGFEMCYADLDGDGYRTSEVVESEDADCADEGEANRDAPLVDCDDSRAGVNPGAEEIPGDGVDQDCDGVDPGGDDDDSVASDSDGDADGTDDSADADGELAVSVEYPPEKGGCSTAPRGPGGLAWLLSLGLIVGLRREN